MTSAIRHWLSTSMPVIGLMRVSKDWDGFKHMLDTAFPKRGNTLNLPLD